MNTKKKFLAAEKVLTFDLDYEPNTILGDIGAHPKVQKGHTEEEMRRSSPVLPYREAAWR